MREDSNGISWNHPVHGHLWQTLVNQMKHGLADNNEQWLHTPQAEEQGLPAHESSVGKKQIN